MILLYLPLCVCVYVCVAEFLYFPGWPFPRILFFSLSFVTDRLPFFKKWGTRGRIERTGEKRSQAILPQSPGGMIKRRNFFLYIQYPVSWKEGKKKKEIELAGRLRFVAFGQSIRWRSNGSQVVSKVSLFVGFLDRSCIGPVVGNAYRVKWS